jgi:hypothetical protein
MNGTKAVDLPMMVVSNTQMNRRMVYSKMIKMVNDNPSVGPFTMSSPRDS